jgi:CHAD domain-containing protein
MLGQRQDGRRLLKVLKPVRKAAGAVRDMDVFVVALATLGGGDEDEGATQLMKHFRSRRVELAERLSVIVDERRGEARRLLKRWARRMEENAEAAPKGSLPGSTLPAEGVAVAADLATELKEWPELDQNNLHAFRLKVKELRYILQLGGESQLELVTSLGEVKDAIGEWHDWQEMARIADEVLAGSGGLGSSVPGVLERIRSVAGERLERALSLSQGLRTKLHGSESVGRRKGVASVKAPKTVAALTG